MNEEFIKQLKEIEKDMIDCFKVYENKMAIVWNKIQKLKKKLKDGKKISGDL
jgi:GTP-binding protein EngB required for normal cell division